MAGYGPVGGGVASVGIGPPVIITTKFDHGLADGERVGLESLFPNGKTIYGHVNHALGGNDFALYADKALRTPAVLPGGAAITDTTTVFRVADEDHAIVVGIGAYPAIPCLEGPVKDALDFERWLRSSAGGCVPEANIALIRSPDFPPLPALADAKPTSEQVGGAFIELVAKALRNESAKYRVGRRLYIFMAGTALHPLTRMPMRLPC